MNIQTNNWSDVAERICEEIPFESLHRSVLAFLQNHPRQRPWVIAVSGGADSVALLFLLWAHFPEARSHMHVAHFNHCLRPDQDDQESAYVRLLAESLELSYHEDKWERSSDDAVNEATARDARHSFFRRVFENKPFFLFTGHHRRDVAETMLMRIARGGTFESLIAPRPVHEFSDGHVRLKPLLDLYPENLKVLLSKYDIRWYEDVTNMLRGFTRNNIRLDVIPALNEAMGRSFEQGAAKVHRLLEEVDAYFRESIEKVPWRNYVHSHKLKRGPFFGVPTAQRRYLFRAWMDYNDISELLSSKLEDWAVAPGEISSYALNRKLRLRLDDYAFYIEEIATEQAEPFYLSLASIGSVYFPSGKVLKTEMLPVTSDLMRYLRSGCSDPSQEAWLNCSGEDRIVLRSWESGDRYEPMGLGGSISLQDAFINRKIPAEERKILPLVCIGLRIAWVPGLIPDEFFKIKPESNWALKLTYKTL